MQIYRGYDIMPVNGLWSVIKDGKTVYIAKSEEDAMNWIDAQKRKR